ncbi:hypothetical protein [Leptodesmis sichuanensis]|uniref:hypothetical protein n=1 Tax=Leptodesmis sichuanensis TaxID=2906798 RepID=UPI001F292257|nr:hypothetical protein [Leptodesmis sichuanensis]UIE36022.1 hypothetical protein KIK02_13070 [Leptodesmis sichuanensis A121]
MNATEQIKALKMRPGARPGQIILGIDLSEVEHPSQVLSLVEHLGYDPQLRYLELNIGLHILAVLKDEQHDPMVMIDDDYLMDEWEALTGQITPSTAVRLWRGLPKEQARVEQ